MQLPEGGQWVSFLRNHDELDLSRLTDEQRGDVFRAFAPRPEMRLYGRGIRRRLAPMLHGDVRRIELAYALQFSMPGTPALRYGEEIGMGEDLSLDGREAVRTPMQWDDTANAGFSSAAPDALFRPVTMTGRFGAKKVNVRAQQRDPASLLRWFENLIHTLRSAREIGTGTCSVVDASAAALGIGAPIRRAGRIDPAAAQLGGHQGDGGHWPHARHGCQALRPVRGRPVRGTQQEADRPRPERLGLPMDTPVAE